MIRVRILIALIRHTAFLLLYVNVQISVCKYQINRNVDDHFLLKAEAV